MLTSILLIIITGFGLGFLQPTHSSVRNNQLKNGEPCDWFIDLLQKRRFKREATIPAILADVTEDPTEYASFNYSAPFEFAGDHISEDLNNGTETAASVVGCNGNKSGCSLCSLPTTTGSTATPLTTTAASPSTATPCATTAASPSTATPRTTTAASPSTKEEDCDEKRAVFKEIKNLSNRNSQNRIRQRLKAQREGRKRQHQSFQKLGTDVKKFRRVKRNYKAHPKNYKIVKAPRLMTRQGDCFKTEDPTTERVLLEANIHIGDGFQELLLDMLSPGDKTIKISEEEENQKPPQMRWEVIEDERRR